MVPPSICNSTPKKELLQRMDIEYLHGMFCNKYKQRDREEFEHATGTNVQHARRLLA
jgi:hypothetical protein